MDLSEIQAALIERGVDAWLFFDHHQRDPIAYRVLGLSCEKMTTRRWFYCIPARGTPTKIVHRIESKRLDGIAGVTEPYAGWRELREKLVRALKGYGSVAMQYSPEGNIPLVSNVDGGTIDLIRSLGVSVVSSADLVQLFSARLTKAQIESHRETGMLVQQIKDEAFALVSAHMKREERLTEFDLQAFILQRFNELHLTCGGHAPIVAVDEHAADPHFEVSATQAAVLARGHALMIDLWAKSTRPDAVYYDITWCAWIGETPDPAYAHMFSVAVEARKRAKQYIVDRLASGHALYGFEVDQAARNYIAAQGFGQYFTHRLGHSIDADLHGSGVNIDDLETRDDRQIIPGLCFSIEPGIYNPPFGVRTEIDVVIDYSSKAVVFGEEQEQLILC